MFTWALRITYRYAVHTDEVSCCGSWIPGPSRRRELVLFSALVAISTAFVLWSIRFILLSSVVAIDGHRYFSLFDDAMISMRYAWNLAHGRGLVWNPGEYVEGYTNLLMVLVMAIPNLLFERRVAVLSIQLLGAVLMLGSAALALGIARQLVPGDRPRDRDLAGVLTFGLTLAYYPLAYWSLMGMETGLLTVLVLASTYLALRHYHDLQWCKLVPIALLLGLAYLTRPDATVYAAAIIAFIIYRTYQALPLTSVIRRGAFVVLCYLAVVLLQTIFRASYYGELVPNTYTLKVEGMPLLYRVRSGLGFIRPFVVQVAPVVVVALLALRFRPDSRRAFLLTLFFGTVGYQVSVGGDAWTYWRIMTPSMPLLLALFVIGLLGLMRGAGRLPERRISPGVSVSRWAGPIVGVLLVGAAFVSLNWRFRQEVTLQVGPYQADNNAENVNTAIALRTLTTPDATVGIFWAGTIPYYADRRAVDFLGKSDPHIARLPPDLSGVSQYGSSSLPGHNKYDLDYSIRGQAPTYVQGFVWGRQNLTAWGSDHYVVAHRRNVRLVLRRDAPEVLWDRVDRLSQLARER